MADITTPQLVRFANERARIVADEFVVLYETCKRFQTEWIAFNAATTPNTADNFADGSAADGRKRFTGSQMQGLKVLVDAVVGFLESGGPPTRITQLQAISVNGTPRF